MIKVYNQRREGSLFHYAHFICDCLFPEVVNGFYKYNEVVRKKSLHQTIGNFSKIYTEVMGVKHTEIEDFDNSNVITYPNRETYEEKDFYTFRDYIFSKYKLKDDYPPFLLIRRGERINLIYDDYLSKINKNVTTGKERREIKNIDTIEIELKKYGFKTVYFEQLPFEEQVNYFYNAKIIVCAHGAVMSNMFFCKEGTTIIEVPCGKAWSFFDKISRIFKLNHIKCNAEGIIRRISAILG